MTVITTNKALNAFCRQLAEEAFITVDTEFIREKTYWPRLCLVQVAGQHEAACIDPLASGLDLTPLYALLHNPAIIKVFHAARQDLEIFYHQTGRVPQPLFDTQVAAMVCGFGDSVSYEHLVSKLTKGRIDKASRFTDWAHRPLSTKQITYALSDVTHLRLVYGKLRRKLEQTERASWLDQEMDILSDPATYKPDPQNVWRRIKSRGGKPRALALLRELAAWRENEAIRLDLPRNRVLRDDALVEIAHHAPQSVADLARTRGLSTRVAEGEMGRQLLAAVARGLAVPDADCPQPPQKPDLPPNLGPVVELLKVLLKHTCQEANVAGKLVATSADVELIAGLGEDADVPALKGWRYQVFGAQALALRQGNIALRVVNRKLQLIDM